MLWLWSVTLDETVLHVAGSYQPSNELQLRFYAYYKQATEGFNYHPRPSFWEVVKRAKWDAWSKLGNMSKEEAMIHYVEELRKALHREGEKGEIK
ncbi:Acyl-CoA binding domain containing 5 [Homalodisca vitripennis]|nr:Acyl-CoA binding domain containing 5 [Homalodisca vitripennis]